MFYELYRQIWRDVLCSVKMQQAQGFHTHRFFLITGKQNSRIRSTRLQVVSAEVTQNCAASCDVIKLQGTLCLSFSNL